MFLWLLSWVALAGQVLFGVLSLAAGLYYLAEVIEEYSVLAKKVISYMLVFVLLSYILLLFDGLPVVLIVLGLLSHICYGSLLTTFPSITLLSPGFLGGTGLLLVAHYFAFQYFATEWHPFQEVLSFFFLCLWMVPFGFFISLSANDLALPTLGGDSDGAKKRPRRSGFLAVVDFMANKVGSITPSRSSKSF